MIRKTTFVIFVTLLLSISFSLKANQPIIPLEQIVLSWDNLVQVNFTGLGLQLIGNEIRVKLSPGSGLEFYQGGISLLRSCPTGYILRWNGSAWVCSSAIKGEDCTACDWRFLIKTGDIVQGGNLGFNYSDYGNVWGRWMTIGKNVWGISTGIRITWGSDQMFIGLYDRDQSESSINDANAVIIWGDDANDLFQIRHTSGWIPFEINPGSFSTKITSNIVELRSKSSTSMVSLRLYGNSSVNAASLELRDLDFSGYWVIQKRDNFYSSQANWLIFSYYDGSSWHQMLNLLPNGVIYVNGDVGIGTTNPSAKLDVNGNILIRGWDAVLKSMDTETGYIYHLIGTYHGWDPTGVYIAGYNAKNGPSVSNVTKVYIGGPESTVAVFDLMNQRVGIGTVSPTYVLHIKTASTSPLSTFAIEKTVNEEASMKFITPYNKWTLGINSPGALPGEFFIHDTTNGIFALVIQNGTGYVGIGVISPTERLDVAGNVKVSGTVYVYGNQEVATKQDVEQAKCKKIDKATYDSSGCGTGFVPAGMIHQSGIWYIICCPIQS